MSYVPLSTISSRGSPTLDNDKETASEQTTPYPRRSSSFPLLSSRRTSTSSLSPEADDWIRLRQDRSSQRKIIGLICVIAFGLVSAAIWVKTDTRGVTWATRMLMGTVTAPFLIPKPTKRVPPGSRRVLTNPLVPTERLKYDVTLTLESIPIHIKAGVPTTLVIRCAHADLEQCAKSYRVLFIGPTIRATYFNDSEVIGIRHVKVHFRIDDPGLYQIYAWPEFAECDFWSREEFWTGPQFYKLAVGGTPFGVNVEGSPPKESSRACTAHDDLSGRWVSKNHFAPPTLEPGSPFFDWIQTQLNPSSPPTIKGYPPVHLPDYRSFGYVYTPYSCKIPHRSTFEWLDEVKPDTVLVIGDAITRDFFCLNWGFEDQDVCRYSTNWDYRDNNKHIAHVRSDKRTSNLYFHWNPVAYPDGVAGYIDALPTPPTHIFFAAHLWFTRRNSTPEHYVESVRPFLERLEKVAPRAKIVTRTSSSAVQALGCFELANITRWVLEPVNKAYLKLLRNEFPRIKAIDAYPIYNDLPQSSSDGAKWERLPGQSTPRSEEGAIGPALTDLIFETWRLQG